MGRGGGGPPPPRTHRAVREPLFRAVPLPRSLSQLVLSPASPKRLLRSMKCAFFSLFTVSGLWETVRLHCHLAGGALPCVLAAPCGLPTAGSERSPATPGALVTPRLVLLTPSQPTAEAVNHTTTASWHTHPSELVPGPCARWKVTNAVSQMRNRTAAEAERCRLLDFSSC